MNSLKMSAMFAAYVWFTGRAGESTQTQKEAMSFARANWESFLPNAHDGLGRLLMRIARERKRRMLGRKKATVVVAG